MGSTVVRPLGGTGAELVGELSGEVGMGIGGVIEEERNDSIVEGIFTSCVWRGDGWGNDRGGEC